MSYEDAPSTRLLATHCAACGRPLRDAVSVERGMGPDCAEKYGLADAQGEPRWNVATELLAVAGIGLPNGWAKDAQLAVNALVNVAACAQKKSPVALAGAITALGYAKLGAVLLSRLQEAAEIRVARETGPNGTEVYLVTAPYSEAFTAAVRAVRGQWWDKARKVRVAPVTERRALWTALQASYPAGTLVACGDKMAAL